MAQSLTGLQVVSFESRLRSETAGLIEKHGGRVIAAPALKEVPLIAFPAAKVFVDALFDDAVDALILLTGVGTTLLLRGALKQRARAELISRLTRVTLVCRGPKPSAALKPFGLRPTFSVPEPNTWRDLIATLDAEFSVHGRRVYVQEYGRPNPRLLHALAERGALVKSLQLYEWSLPDDTGPLKAAILKIVRGQAHVALFTTALQVEHLLLVAQDIGMTHAVRRALNTELVVASVGPITSEALEHHGIAPDIVPGHPKLGHLMLAVARRAPDLLRDKRARAQQPITPARAGGG